MSKHDELCIQIEELCTKNEELCIKNDGFCRFRILNLPLEIPGVGIKSTIFSTKSIYSGLFSTELGVL